MKAVHLLYPAEIFPLATLSYMLLIWQRGCLEEAELGDGSDNEEHFGPSGYTTMDGDGEPFARHFREEDYEK